MMLYAMTTRQARTWCLDLATPGALPGTATATQDLPSVYALIVPRPLPSAVYIGATRQLRSRIGHHLSRSRRALARAAREKQPPRNPVGNILKPVLDGRSALLVIRLEALPGADGATLRRHELAWLLVATREELPLARQRGPAIHWPGEPSELRAAFRLARHRRWPSRWVSALTPLCLERALPAGPPAPRPGLPRSWPPGPRGRAATPGRTDP